MSKTRLQNTKMKKIISKHLVEIRYKPSSRFLDKRGEIADLLSSTTFDQWNISSNRIDFSSKEQENIGAFISFRNLGLFTNYPNTQDFLWKRQRTLFAPHGQIFLQGILPV